MKYNRLKLLILVLVMFSFTFFMSLGTTKAIYRETKSTSINLSVVEAPLSYTVDFVTNNGDTEPLISDYKKGMNKYKKIVSKVNSTLKALVLYPDLHLRIARHSWKQFTIGFTDSTTKVVFFDRDLMVRINKERL